VSLLEHLEKRNGSDHFLHSGNRWISVEEARSASYAVRRQFSTLRGGAVMLESGEPADTVLGLLSLDGFAGKLLLVGSSLSDEERHDFSRRASVDQSVGCGSGKENSLRWDNVTGLNDGSGPDLETRWIIPTSGTTGKPKLVEHLLESLASSIKRDTSRGKGLVWGVLYDITRFAGIQVLLQAVLGGSALALPSNITDLTAIRSQFAAAGVNALSATPSMWRKLVMSGVLDGLQIKIVTLGGETADEMILRELRTRFPEARITHIYASTEAGVGFSVVDGKAGFPVDYTKDELAGGVTLRVDDNNRLFIRKTVSRSRYVGNEPALVDEQGWIDTGDLVEQRGDRFHFLGRANGTINVGGHKVHPAEIENVILSVEGVAMASVTGRSNPIMGNVVEAWVVPVRDTDPVSLRGRILAECKCRMEPFKVPASLKIVQDLPLTLSGKIRRQY